MLQSVRKYTQGWVATVMGVILSFAFILWGIENYLSGSSKKHIVAKVNGKEITAADVENDFQRTLMRLKDQVGSNFNLPSLMQQQLKAQTLNNLIIQNVLVHAALSSGFMVTPQETGALIKQMPAFQENGHFSREKFQLIINKMAYTKEQFFDDVSKSLLINQVATGISGTEFILPNEMNLAISLLEQKRDIEYVLIPKELFKNIRVSQEQIKQYYLQHQNQFMLPARIQIDYILLTSDDLNKDIEVSEKDLNEYFESNTDLDKTNVKVINNAKQALRQQKLEQAFLAASDKLGDLTYTNSDSLDVAANTLGLKVMTSEYFSQEGGRSNITKNPKIISLAFNPDFLKSHTNSNLIEIAPGKIAVLRQKNYQPQALAPIKDVEEKIKHQLVEMNANNLAREKMRTILNKIENKDDFEKIIKNEHLALNTKNQVSRHEAKLSPDLLRVAFSIIPSAKKPCAGAELANGACIVYVKNSTNFPIEKITDDQRKTIGKLYTDMYGKVAYDLYLANQVNLAKITAYNK